MKETVFGKIFFHFFDVTLALDGKLLNLPEIIGRKGFQFNVRSTLPHFIIKANDQDKKNGNDKNH